MRPSLIVVFIMVFMTILYMYYDTNHIEASLNHVLKNTCTIPSNTLSLIDSLATINTAPCHHQWVALYMDTQSPYIQAVILP